MAVLPQISEAELEVMKDEYIGQESDTFVRRFFNGDPAAMISAYINNHKLAETEIETLLTLLLEYLERMKE